MPGHFTFTVDRDRSDFYKLNVEIVIDESDHEAGFPCDASEALKVLYFALHHDCALSGWEELDIARQAMTAVEIGVGAGNKPLPVQIGDLTKRLSASTRALSGETDTNG